MKKGCCILALTLSVIFILSSHALAAPVANWQLGGGWPFFDDYDIFVGVGNISSPLWEAQIEHMGDGIHNSSGTFDISGGSANLWGNTWYLEVDDNWGINDSYIQNFSIQPGDGNTYTASGLPIFVPDNETRYAYVSMPQNPSGVPEPATTSLLGLGLLGYGWFKKKFKGTAR